MLHVCNEYMWADYKAGCMICNVKCMIDLSNSCFL